MCDHNNPCKACAKIAAGGTACVPSRHLNKGTFGCALHRDMVPAGKAGKWVVVVPVDVDHIPSARVLEAVYEKGYVSWNGEITDEVYDEVLTTKTQPYVFIYGRTPSRAKKRAAKIFP